MVDVPPEDGGGVLLLDGIGLIGISHVAGIGFGTFAFALLPSSSGGRSSSVENRKLCKQTPVETFFIWGFRRMRQSMWRVNAAASRLARRLGGVVTT